MNSTLKPVFVVLLVFVSVIFVYLNLPLLVVWPIFVALSVVWLTRKALFGLLAGSVAGALILAKGDIAAAGLSLFRNHLIPQFGSTWKLGAIGFTLLLGGFAAVLEKGGGFEKVFERFLKRTNDPAKGLQLGVFGLGLVCFFDGLANSMLVGRISRKLGPRCGVSREKLAYLVDSTSASVACVAFISTWIAYQLSMIKEGFQVIGQDVNPYLYFIRSVPFNFYCWATLALCLICILRNFNPGSMRSAELSVRSRVDRQASEQLSSGSGSIVSIAVPLFVLLFGTIGGFYIIGIGDAISIGSFESYFPVTADKLAIAFETSKGPHIMCSMGLIGGLSAMALYPHAEKKEAVAIVYVKGVQSMLMPLFILLGAWMLSSTLSDLETGKFISGLMGASIPSQWIPLSVFVTGALISFAVGSSWATMGILMPLAIPIVAQHPEMMDAGNMHPMYAITVAAVFSGAVFGDHCSPISDTTIISSIACGVEPHDHVRTQMPFAMLAAGAAGFFGFLPAGFGVSSWASLLAILLVLIGIGWKGSKPISAGNS